MQIDIYKMEINDLDSISNILFEEFDDFWTYNVFKSELENENSRYIVAKQGNQIVGFAGIWIAIDEAHITNIVTRKTYRKCGIGSLLLQHLISMSQDLKLKSITLEVNEINKPAICLYKMFGFENVGVRKKYYQNSYDAIIMTKFV